MNSVDSSYSCICTYFSYN